MNNSNPSVLNLDEYINMLECGVIEQRAAAIALRYGNKLGARNNQWAIDQMLRLISGNAYKTLITVYEAEHGPGSWDTGQLPEIYTDRVK